MLNIISRSLLCPYATGPQKVVTNLIKGLDKLNYPYVTNKNPLYGDYLWIHDDVEALNYIQNKRHDKVIVGPNIAPIKDLNIDFNKIVLLQPSEWAKDFCLKYRFAKSVIEAWPTGIDTDICNPISAETKDFVLIYHKQRFDYELSLVEAYLQEQQINYKIIKYGEYRQAEYLDLLKQTKYIIWIGRQESQGIALQEALALNVPIVVWDVLCIGHWYCTSKSDRNYFTREEGVYRGATVAGYFNEDCGYKVQNFDEVLEKISAMERNYQSFNPRKFIIENLSLENQAQALLDIFIKYNFSTTPISVEPVVPTQWRNALLWNYLYRAKKIIKG